MEEDYNGVSTPPMNKREYSFKSEYDYPKKIIATARDENAQVSIHAMGLFDAIVKKRFAKTDAMRAEFEFWPGEDEQERVDNLNHTLNMVFELAERFRIATEIDKWARLENMYKASVELAPSIVHPGASAQKDSMLTGEVPGLHDR